MKKIMFNDKYGLTQAVLEGRKTMTRRMAEKVLVEDENCELRWNGKFKPARFKVGEAVAIAQSYEEVFDEYAEIAYIANKPTPDNFKAFGSQSDITLPRSLPGWTNKMFVRADLMPHHIRITDVRLERLRDINSEDCLKEGIEARIVGCHTFYFAPGIDWPFNFPKPAFAALIDKVSCKGTFDSNPWVYVYTFDLVK